MHHSSTASILQNSAFSVVQLSHPYMTTGKTIALTRWTFVGKVMSLRFHMLSRFAYNKLSKEQASFSFMAAVTICSDFGAQKNKVSTVEHILILISSALVYTDCGGYISSYISLNSAQVLSNSVTQITLKWDNTSDNITDFRRQWHCNLGKDMICLWKSYSQASAASNRELKHLS